MLWRRLLARTLLLAALLAPCVEVKAGPIFGKGIGGAMYYGPYTGGHLYSYNVAYSYVLPFSPADSWRRDLLAFPGGPYPYRPPYRYFQSTPTHIAVPGGTVTAPGTVIEPLPHHVVALKPIPPGSPATVSVTVPPGAEVWFDSEKTTASGPERIFQSPPLQAGKSYVYTVRVRWSESGREQEQVQVVGVQAGGSAHLNFPRGR